MFDLSYTSIHIINSALQPESPGLVVTNPIKRVVRGREDEQLILFLTLTGENNPVAESTRRLIDKTVEAYYQTPGSATAALRQAVQVINASLFDRNRRSSLSSTKLYGHISAVSLRGFRLVGAQAGQTHALIMTGHACEHFTPINPEDTLLGMTDNPALSFFQAEIGEDSRLFFADREMPAWDELSRPNSPSVSSEAVQKKLLSWIPSIFEGALVRLALGTGKNVRIPFNELVPQSSFKVAQEPITGPAMVRDERSSSSIPVSPLISPEQIDDQGETGQPVYSTDIPKPIPAIKKDPIKALLYKVRLVKEKFSSPFLWFREHIHIRKPQIKINPGEIKQAARLSNGSMILIAIGIPIVISTLALLVYINKGQTQQSLYYTALAQASANEALSQTDPQAQYLSWTNTVAYLDQAEKYKVTDLTQALRKQAENAVDGVDKTIRLEYRAAITNSLPPTVKVGKIVATATEIYMLDTRKGQAYRASLTGHGYEIDENFNCGPSPFIGPLVDIAPLSINNIYKATLLGVDAKGTLLFCSPEKTPDAIHLSPPSKGIGNITAFAYDSGSLYLLDEAGNALWVYISQDGIFKTSPTSLTATAPINLSDTVSLAVNGPDLYLLHKDGHLSLCTISYVDTAPTQCSDPAAFSDSRPGRETNPFVFQGTSFNQIEYVPPPDPSIFMFDLNTNAVYHFSLKLNLHRVISPLMTGSNRLPKSPATAFTVSPNRTIFIAFGNQIYVAIAP